MPLYEYACEKCEHAFESLVFGDEKVECPKCESTKVERLLSVPGRPKISEGSSNLPMACNSDGPACGAPWCRKK